MNEIESINLPVPKGAKIISYSLGWDGNFIGSINDPIEEFVRDRFQYLTVETDRGTFRFRKDMFNGNIFAEKDD